MEIVLQGQGVSPGIAIGPAHELYRGVYEIPKYKVADVDAEAERFEAAIDATRRDLTALYQETLAALGKSHADIFHVHIMMLDDMALRDEVTSRIRATGFNAESVLDTLAHQFALTMEKSADLRYEERTADLLDVVDRVLHHLLDTERPAAPDVAEPSILVGPDIPPSIMMGLNVGEALGIALERGGNTSHSAILARALELPAVVGVEGLADHVESGDTVALDGATGAVVVNPKPETLDRYRAAQRIYAMRVQQVAETAGAGPCQTTDGVHIATRANIQLPLEITPKLKRSAQGIGLYRTEYLFLNRTSVPSEEEQYTAYAAAAEAMAPEEVVLRTVDIGGDKLLEHLQIVAEPNPQLGWRAIRFCLRQPKVFKAHLRAMLRASVHENVAIMFPMVSRVEEFKEARAIVNEVMEEMVRNGVAFDRDVRIGSMIEIPSAALTANALAAECDFFSIGTNDLTQYTLAVDRVNDHVADLYEPLHPAVIRLIKMTADAARAEGIPCAVCGEMAGDALYSELLIGLGITELSAAPMALPAVRSEIRRISAAAARRLADQVIGMEEASAIRALLRERYAERNAQPESSSDRSKPFVSCGKGEP